MVLTLGVSLGLPAEDVLDAVYDESEAVPYEFIPLDSISLSPLSARSIQAVPNSLQRKVGDPSRFSSAGVRVSDAHQPPDARVSLALFCTLLC